MAAGTSRDLTETIAQDRGLQELLYRLKRIEERQELEDEKAHRISAKLRKVSVGPTDVVHLKKALGDLAAAYSEGHSSNKARISPSGLIRDHVSDFYSNISIPGVKYCMEQHRYSFERYLWVFVLLVSLMVSSRFIQESYVKWQGSPTLLSFNDSMTSVSLLPFPAVTICSPSQLRPDFHLEETMHDCFKLCSHEECNKVLAARLLCPHSKKFPPIFSFDYLNLGVDIFIKQISLPCETFVSEGNVTFAGKQLPCGGVLQTIFVDGKVCHTFNMLPPSDMFRSHVVAPIVSQSSSPSRYPWTLESVLLPQTRGKAAPGFVPRHSLTSGRWDGLNILLRLPRKFNSKCKFPNKHTKIALHSPGEFPLPETHTFFRLEKGSLNLLRVTPNLVTAQEELLEYQPAKRKCFFSHERKLTLFRVYTKRNCILECKANCSLSLCGCVPFHLPRMNSSVRVCGHMSRCGNIQKDREDANVPWDPKSTHFLETNLQVDELFDKVGYTINISDSMNGSSNCTMFDGGAAIFTVEEDANFSFFLPDEDEEKTTSEYPHCKCDCRPDCVTVSYSVMQEDQPVDDPKPLDANTLALALSYKNGEFTSTVRKELIGFTDFIANSGGVLGVFTGFSFLALAELLYYLTFRLWSTVKQSWECEAATTPNLGLGPLLETSHETLSKNMSAYF